MTLKRRGLLAAMLCGILTTQSNTASAEDGWSLNLTELREVMGHPPNPWSPAERKDLVTLRRLQQSRTPEQIVETWLMVELDLATFTDALGHVDNKTVASLLRGLRPFLDEVDKVTTQFKLEVKRPRPYMSHPDLEACLPTDSGYSFPSRHATYYTAAAELLAGLVPERRESLMQVANRASASRVTCSVHYPSDVEAGERIGRKAATQIKQSAAWRAFVSDAAVQAEVKMLRALAASPMPSDATK